MKNKLKWSDEEIFLMRKFEWDDDSRFFKDRIKNSYNKMYKEDAYPQFKERTFPAFVRMFYKSCNLK